MDKDKIESRNDAHFEIPPCQLERASQPGKMRITSQIVEITPRRSRQHYALPLTTVAEMIVSKCMKANVQAKGIAVPKARR